MAHPKKNPLVRSEPRVAVLVDTATTWGRGIITGIHHYSRKHGGWHLYIEAKGAEEALLLPRSWQGEGIIARVGTPQQARHLARQRIPVVNVSGIQLPGPELPRVANDVEAVARLAARYFLDRGFRHFAYLSLRGLEYVARQRDAFVQAVTTAGFECAELGVKVQAGAQSPDWNLKLEKLGRWLSHLPKPVALLTWSGGREVIHACQKLGLRVPEEIALLNGSDDEFLSELSPIPVSGVQAAYEEIGYKAANLLDRLMHGSAAPKKAKLVAPVRVATRQSTDTLALSDPALIAALGFIRDNAARPIRVSDVAGKAGISRTALERRFAAVLGHPPAVHICRVRLDNVKKLLAETDLPIGELAAACGFGSPEYMTHVFRTEMGITPLRYRREIRGR